MSDTQGSRSDNGVSRRSFLLGAGVFAGAAAVTGLVGCSPSSGGSSSASSKEEPQQDQSLYVLTAPEKVSKEIDCDVVVVGAGISGLAATVQAAELGLNVVCLEKSSMPGGNGLGTEGVFAIGSDLQKQQGIEITPAQIISAELEESQWRGDGSLWLDMCENSSDNIDWLVQNGVLFSGKVDNYYTGLFPTMHWFDQIDGSMGNACYVKPMAAAAEEAGATFEYQCKAYMLIQDTEGKVAGLYAEDLAGGGYVKVNAKAVILASGGIGANPELLLKQGWQQHNIDDKISMCTPTVEGDGYKMAMTAGARDYLPLSCDQAFIGIKALGTDQTPPYSSTLNGANGIAGAGTSLWVNQDGRRFTNEAINSFNLAAPEAACCKNNLASYALFDQSTVDAEITDPADLELLSSAVADKTNSDSFVKADSIEELAKNFGLDSTVLTEQVSRYNAYCAAGKDEDFGKDASFLKPLTAPFYMGKIVPLFVVIIGGVTTNVRAEVLDEKFGAIPGLYAIGLEGAMLHRNVYTQNMPGSNMGNNVNSGRNAARNVSKFIKG